MTTECVVAPVVLRRLKMPLVTSGQATNRFKFTPDYERKKVLVEAEFVPETAGTSSGVISGNPIGSIDST
jgi:hypothetical protein